MVIDRGTVVLVCTDGVTVGVTVEGTEEVVTAV